MKLSVSDIKDFRRCEKLAYYKHNLLRSPAKSDSVALTVGTIWHKGMEVFLRERSADAAAAAMLDEVSKLEASDLHAKASYQLGILAAGLTYWTVPSDWEVLSIEQVLSASLPRWRTGLHHANDHILQGRLDAIVRWNGKVWHVQHKTVDERKNLPLYWRQMERDWHECAYAYLLERNGFDNYGGTLLIAARKVAAKRLDPTNPSNIIVPQFISRPQHVIDKAVDDIYLIMNRWQANLDAARASGGPGNFIEDRDQCTGPWGNSPCPYLDVCNGLISIDDPTKFVDTPDRYESPDDSDQG